ncbi:MAG: hypothetical protein QXU87_09390 [Candidatus Caldarchaeum sp.]
MASRLIKVISTVASVTLTLSVMFQLFQELRTAVKLLMDTIASFYGSYQPYSTIATAASLLLTVLAVFAKRLARSTPAGYFYAPKGTIELGRGDMGKFETTFIAVSKDGVLERIIKSSVDRLSQDGQAPLLWIKLFKETVARSYLLGEEKKLYELDVLGKKSALKEFLGRLSRRLEVYDEKAAFKIIEADLQPNKWASSITDIKDVKALPSNIKLKEETIFGWVWRILLASVATALVMYLVMRLMGRGINREKAINIASRHLEENHGVKPVLTGVREEADAYVINFETHHVSVHKRSGRIITVSKV